MPEEFQNILIVRTDRIGDVVLTTPAITALRRRFPRARLTMLVQPLTLPLVDRHPDVDEILVDDRKGVHRGARGFFLLGQTLREKKFDLAIVYHTKKRTNALCAWARIPIRLGYKNNKWGFLLTQPVLDDRAAGTKHETEYCLDLLRPLGVEGHAEDVHVSCTPGAENWANEFCRRAGGVSPEGFIALHTGASDPAKCWKPEGFAELIKKLKDRFSGTFVFVGDAAQSSKVRGIQAQLDLATVDLCGQTSVAQLVSFLRRCSLLISNDSGPVHIAAALGVPVVSLFTRNEPGINPERWHPLGPRSRTVAVPAASSGLLPKGKSSFRKSGPLKGQFCELIRVEQVLEAVDAVCKLC